MNLHDADKAIGGTKMDLKGYLDAFDATVAEIVRQGTLVNYATLPGQREAYQATRHERRQGLMAQIEAFRFRHMAQGRDFDQRVGFVVDYEEYEILREHFAPYNWPENGDRLQVMGVRIVVAP